jgi:cysteine desulfurase
MTKKSVYLDYAAATPVDDRVMDAMEPYFSKNFFNPSANYLLAQKIKDNIDQARKQVALNIGVKSNEIIFTAGGSEANNLAISGVMDNNPGSNLIISAIEHPSVSEPAKKYDLKICPVDSQGLLKLSNLKELINDQTALISVIYVSNEIGTIEPLDKISHLISEIRKSRLMRGVKVPLYLHSDAAQAANYLDLHVSRLGLDMMTLNGGKIYGPKQSGALYLKSGCRLKPIIYGGGQERNLRSGTLNVPSIIGFAKSLDLAQQNRKDNAQRILKLQQYFIDQLQTLEVDLVVNGSLNSRVANNVHVTFKGVDNEALLIKLDLAGIMAAAGSACSASSEEPSSVLKAIGLSDLDAQSSIRFTLGNQTTKNELDYTVSTLKKLLK